MSWLLGPDTVERTSRSVAYPVVGSGILDFSLFFAGASIGLGLLVAVLGISLLVVTLPAARVNS